MERKDLLRRITVNPAIFGGKPIVRGMRIPVDLIFALLAEGETVAIDPDLEAWLRNLWARRNMPFASINLKQAWLIPSATAIPTAVDVKLLLSE